MGHSAQSSSIIKPPERDGKRIKCLECVVCAEEENAVVFVQELVRRLGGSADVEEEDHALSRTESLEGTTHFGHLRLPTPGLDESPFELRALEISLDLVSFPLCTRLERQSQNSWRKALTDRVMIGTLVLHVTGRHSSH